MPNWFGDPGMELQLRGYQTGRWCLDGATNDTADFLNTGTAYQGSWVMAGHEGRGIVKLMRFGQIFDPPSLDPAPGYYTTPRNLRVWIRIGAGGMGPAPDDWVLRFRMQHGHFDPSGPNPGYPVEWSTDVGFDELTTEWQQFTLQTNYIPTYSIAGNPDLGWDKTLAVYANFIGAGFPIGVWYFEFDNWTWLTDQEEQEMAKRRDILDAAKTTLEGITVANGHPVEVLHVNIGYLTPQNVESWPTLCLVYGEEIKDTREMHRKKATLLLHVVIYAEDSATYGADEQCDLLAESIETILETKVANTWLSLAYIEDLSLVKIEPFEVPEDVARGRRVWVTDVQVTYHYDRLDP